MRPGYACPGRPWSDGPSRQDFILTMKLHHLIRYRHTLLRQTRLANLAFAYAELGKYADRIARGKLRGQVTLQLADPDAQRDWPTLVAEEGSQAVIDEHFLDEDILDLADLLVFAAGDEPRAASRSASRSSATDSCPPCGRNSKPPE